MGFKEKLFNGELKIYPVEDVYRIYGKTFEDKDEIKEQCPKPNFIYL